MHSEIKYFKAGDDIAAELDTSDGIVAGWFCCVGKKNAKALMRNKKPDFTGFAKAFCNKYPRKEFGIHSCNVETGEVYSSTASLRTSTKKAVRYAPAKRWSSIR